MNKRIISLLVISFILSLFSCDWEKESPNTAFADYESFLSIKEGWMEPENYSFSYTFAYGDTYVTEPITVTVSEGIADVYYGNKDTLSDDYGDITFESITDIFVFFNTWWANVSAADNTSDIILFSAAYKSAGDVTYPQLLSESITTLESTYDGGYGGIYISISDFSIE